MNIQLIAKELTQKHGLNSARDITFSHVCDMEKEHGVKENGKGGFTAMNPFTIWYAVTKVAA